MKLVRSLAFSVSVAAAAASLMACSGAVEQPQTSASAATKAPVAAQSEGMVRLVGNALSEVPLRADQRVEIDKLVVDADARHAPLVQGRKDLTLAFADQVEKGAIDKAALQPKIDKLAADLEAVRAGDRAAILKLHDLLDANQRNAFVDAFHDQMKGKHGEHGGRGAHGFGQLRQLGEDLKLTDAQRAQLRDVFRDAHRSGGAQGMEAWKGHHKGKGEGGPGRHGGDPRQGLESFRQDKLDLDKAPVWEAKAHAGEFAGRITTFAEKIVPILTPEQRKIAADKIRAMAAQGSGPLQ